MQVVPQLVERVCRAQTWSTSVRSRVGQRRPGAGQPRLHGPHRDAQDRRDLLDRQVGQVVQHDDRPEVLRRARRIASCRSRCSPGGTWRRRGLCLLAAAGSGRASPCAGTACVPGSPPPSAATPPGCPRLPPAPRAPVGERERLLGDLLGRAEVVRHPVSGQHQACGNTAGTAPRTTSAAATAPPRTLFNEQEARSRRQVPSVSATRPPGAAPSSSTAAGSPAAPRTPRPAGWAGCSTGTCRSRRAACSSWCATAISSRPTPAPRAAPATETQFT